MTVCLLQRQTLLIPRSVLSNGRESARQSSSDKPISVLLRILDIELHCMRYSCNKISELTDTRF
jgi:hypothetical protein